MMALMLLELVNIAAQLAQIDHMIAQVTGGMPGTDDAKVWHDISVKALQYSREVLSEKQKSCLRGLRDSFPDAVMEDGALLVEQADTSVVPEQSLTVKETPTWMGWSKETVQSCPAFVPKIQVDEPNGGSLRSDLEQLRKYDPKSVLIVRKIKKLGFESPALLKDYFQQYGVVAEILVAHSHVKPTAKRPNGRVRPAALGFVVMSSATSAQEALEAGVMHVIRGTNIQLTGFESFNIDVAHDVENDR
jgi:hypothetical protein